jgi:hypothetical protein
MVSTTPPKVSKVETSSAKAPMVPALAAQLGDKALEDTLSDDDPNHLNSATVVS